jgi:hypothetical protein
MIPGSGITPPHPSQNYLSVATFLPQPLEPRRAMTRPAMAEIRPVVPLAPFRRLKDARPRDNGDHGEPSNWLFLCVMKLIWRCYSSPISPPRTSDKL